ncbi:MAG: cell division protein FtsZ [Candidatus Micrarchaeota archaeon]
MADEEGNLKFVVAGVGGAGCNSINRLAKSGFKGAKLVAFNTDKKQLDIIPDDVHKVLLGEGVTQGLGAGGDPQIGLKSALATRGEISRHVKDADLVFILAGMGGGTGTGASPIIAQMAREAGALVLGFVYFPFKMEKSRVRCGQKGISKLTDECDSLVVIENDRLTKWAENVPIEQAFAMADDVAAKAVLGISRTILEPSVLNIDFADLKAITADKGLSMISYGESSGPMKVHDIPNAVLDHPLLGVDYSKATGALVHFTGGPDLRLSDATFAGENIMSKLPENVNVSWGARMDDSYEKRLEAFVIFTGIPSPLLLDPDAFPKD